MKRAILLLVASSAMSIVAAVLGGQSASACSCVGFTDQEAFAHADVVFTGVLVDIITPAGDTYASTDPERFVFDVERVYKGDAVDPQTIVTARDGASCGLEIHGSGAFLVYATSTDSIVTGAVDGERYSNLCSGTRPIADYALPTSFGDGRAPTALAPRGDDRPSDPAPLPERSRRTAAATPDQSDASAVRWTVVTIAGVTAAAALVASLIIRHRRRAQAAL